MHGIGILLLASAAGYWVIERALLHKGQVKHVGLLLGSLIILGSLLSALVSATSWSGCPMGKWGTGFERSWQAPAPPAPPSR